MRTEHVVAVIGTVEPRSADTINPKLATGEVEVLAREIRVLSEAKRPPFQIADEAPVSEEMRLRYRYLDLRRGGCSSNLVLRHRVAMAIRRYFDAQGFVEVETPILAKSTPEGARDYLVPSRVHPGEFYALPQSPQIFKQILMISGFDRYFQIVKCFRDEDLRADRQPEFTQVDVEISFATQELVFELIEPLHRRDLRRGRASTVQRPFPRMSYAEAMARYGSRQARPAVRPADRRPVGTACARHGVRAVPRGARQRRGGARARRARRRRVVAPRDRRTRRAGEAARRGGPRLGPPQRRRARCRVRR